MHSAHYMPDALFMHWGLCTNQTHTYATYKNTSTYNSHKMGGGQSPLTNNTPALKDHCPCNKLTHQHTHTHTRTHIPTHKYATNPIISEHPRLEAEPICIKCSRKSNPVQDHDTAQTLPAAHSSKNSPQHCTGHFSGGIIHQKKKQIHISACSQMKMC